MATKKQSVQESLVEFGKSIGALVTAAMVVMDPVVRPMVSNVVTIIKSHGIRSLRFARQLIDRDLVSRLLRPAALLSMLVLAVVYAIVIHALGALGVGSRYPLGEAGTWLDGIALLAIVPTLVLVILTWTLRPLRDADMRRMRLEIARPLINGVISPQTGPMPSLRQDLTTAMQSVTASLNVPGTPGATQALLASQLILSDLEQTMREIDQAAVGGEIREVSALLQSMQNRCTNEMAGIGSLVAAAQTALAGQPDQDQINALTDRQAVLLRLRGWVQQVETALAAIPAQISSGLEARVNGGRNGSWDPRTWSTGFGRPGYAPHFLVALIAQWVIAGFWAIGLAMVLREWHLGEIIAAGHDWRWTGAFIALGGLLWVGAFLWYLFARVLAKAVLIYGLRFVTWAVRLVAKPVIEVLDPTTDDEEIEGVVPENLGLPVDAWAHTVDTVHVYPVGIVCGLLMLLLTWHTVYGVVAILVDALFLLALYLFIVNTTKLANQRVHNWVIIGHATWAVIAFLVWAFQPSLSSVVGAGAVAYLFANIVTPTFVFVLALVTGGLGYLAWKQEKGSLRSILMVVASVLAITTVGMVLARTALAAPPATVVSQAAPSEETPSGLGGFFTHTVNAGSHDASRGHACSTSDPNRPCR